MSGSGVICRGSSMRIAPDFRLNARDGRDGLSPGRAAHGWRMPPRRAAAFRRKEAGRGRRWRRRCAAERQGPGGDGIWTGKAGAGFGRFRDRCGRLGLGMGHGGTRRRPGDLAGGCGNEVLGRRSGRIDQHEGGRRTGRRRRGRQDRRGGEQPVEDEEKGGGDCRAGPRAAEKAKMASGGELCRRPRRSRQGLRKSERHHGHDETRLSRGTL